MNAESPQTTENAAPPMPMCGDCDRPLGLFYAECLTCSWHADLHGTYYHQWVEWQANQRRIRAVQSDGGDPS